MFFNRIPEHFKFSSVNNWVLSIVIVEVFYWQMKSSVCSKLNCSLSSRVRLLWNNVNVMGEHGLSLVQLQKVSTFCLCQSWPLPSVLYSSVNLYINVLQITVRLTPGHVIGIQWSIINGTVNGTILYDIRDYRRVSM